MPFNAVKNLHQSDIGGLVQGCCAETVKFQYDVNSVYFCQFQYIFMCFDVLKSV